MTALTQSELKSNILDVLTRVQSGEDIIIKNDDNEKKMAVIISYLKYSDTQKQRPLGILKGKAAFKIKDDFVLTDEEFFNIYG
jgi:hypothetical protein